MHNPLTLPCPHCNGLNRIPSERLGDTPRCGRCKNPLLLSQPFDLSANNYASQIKGDLPLLVDVWASWCGPSGNGGHTFSETLEQHNQAVKEYLSVLKTKKDE